MIVHADYNPDWPQMFRDEADRVRRALGPLALRIDHVGSTSMPGMAAKPVIDLQVSVAALFPLDGFIAALATIGYSWVSVPPPPAGSPVAPLDETYPWFCRPRQWPTTHHIHLCASGSREERDHLVFRDYLRDHPDVRMQYLDRKRQLAREHIGDTDASREAYSLGKTHFVMAVLAEAARAGYRMPA